MNNIVIVSTKNPTTLSRVSHTSLPVHSFKSSALLLQCLVQCQGGLGYTPDVFTREYKAVLLRPPCTVLNQYWLPVNCRSFSCTRHRAFGHCDHSRHCIGTRGIRKLARHLAADAQWQPDLQASMVTCMCYSQCVKAADVCTRCQPQLDSCGSHWNAQGWL